MKIMSSKMAEEMVKLKSMLLKERRLRKEETIALGRRINKLEENLEGCEKLIKMCLIANKVDGRD